MKRIILFGLVSFFCATAVGQIIVNKGIYKVNFSNAYHEPRYVSYMLYKGGGDCSRDGMSFKNDIDELECATANDYAGRGYDKGHLANAEDFASNCEKEELTFRYYNCLPQTPNLNRGIWKVKETLIRQWSQSQKLYVICGGYFGSTKMGNATIPACCWKIVQSVATKKILFCGWFTNTSNAQLEEISVSELESRLHSSIILLH